MNWPAHSPIEEMEESRHMTDDISKRLTDDELKALTEEVYRQVPNFQNVILDSSLAVKLIAEVEALRKEVAELQAEGMEILGLSKPEGK
jgi:polyhydroxyalkanoate synthesis regulator phasin